MKKNISLEDITFGIENETNRPTEITGRIGRYHDGRTCTQSPAFERRKWKAERDSSISVRNAGFTGCEYVSPVMKGEKGLKNLKKMFEWFAESGHKVNNSCGLHMTFGIESICGTTDPKEIAPFLATLGKYAMNLQDGLYAQTGSRRDAFHYASRFVSGDDNTQCWTTKAIIELAQKENPTCHDISRLGHQSARHKVINFTKVGYGTTSRSVFEFRWGAATCNWKKVLLHVATCLFLIRLAWKNRHHAKDRVGFRMDKRIHRDAPNMGVKTFKDILTKWKMSKCGHGLLEESPTLKENWNDLVDVGFRMAEQYDQKFTGLNPSDQRQAQANRIGNQPVTPPPLPQS